MEMLKNVAEIASRFSFVTDFNNSFGEKNLSHVSQNIP